MVLYYLVPNTRGLGASLAWSCFVKTYMIFFKQVNELTHMMLSNYNNQKLEGSSAGSGGSFSGSGSGNGNVGAYEDDFPELTTTKFSQLRLNTSPPPVNNVPSNTSDFCF